MPNRQKHRGPHSKDSLLFNTEQVERLKEAQLDLSFLLTRGYPHKAAVKLVGDKFRFHERQRKALQHASCSDQEKESRSRKAIHAALLAEQTTFVDGFNVLIITESLLSRGAVFRCRDGAYRDIASVHSTYKRVEETDKALQLIGETLQQLKVAKAIWVLDSPISNSGRLKQRMQELSEKYHWPWDIRLEYNPDKIVADSGEIAISSDGWVLDNATHWFNLIEYIIQLEKVKKWTIYLD